MTPSPKQAWETLQHGNERYAAGELTHPRQDPARQREVASSQHPIAGILCCSDSRVSAEILFDLGIGDAFVIRNAGQVITDDVLGSLEYAVGPLSVPVLVVLSHEACGGVRAAIDSQAVDAAALPPHIANLIAPIVPAVRKVAAVPEGAAIDPSKVDAHEAGQEHLRATVAAILSGSEMISAAVAEGKLAIVSANYQLRDGRVVPDAIVGLAS